MDHDREPPEFLAVGFNPVWQTTLVFERFQVAAVNRARAMRRCAGGKGVHCAIALRAWTGGRVAVAHFLGGPGGAAVHAELAAEGVAEVTVPIAGATRGCTTILCESSGEMTELIEPSPPIAPAEAAAMRERLAAGPPATRGLALCGTFPPGIGPDFYAWLAARKGTAMLLLDAWRDVGPTLTTGAVDILKINAHELADLTGSADPGAAARAARDRWGVATVAITDGPRPALLATAEGLWRLALPRLPRVVNPIGAGDTVAAVLLAELAAGTAPAEAFALALAAASATCQRLEAARFTRAEVLALRPAIAIERLP